MTKLLLIFCLALFLRTIQLDRLPYGFHVDEVRLGWNAYSILKTGHDDRGNLLPLYYNTFGDYRPTGLFFATIPSIFVFGLNEFAVRFPSALFGALTIFPLYFFVKEIDKNKKLKFGAWNLELVASILLAISPWHLSVSRATSEVVVSMFFALMGLLFFLKAINQKTQKYFFYAAAFLIISFFFYHSIRLLAPLFLITVAVYKKSLKKAALAIGAVSFIAVFLITNGPGRERFSQVSIFNNIGIQKELTRMPFEEGEGKVFIARLFHNKPATYLRHFINEYAKYFSADFLLGENAKPARYTTFGVGLLLYTEVALFITGLIVIAKKRGNILPLLLLLIAPLPAALTTEDTPNLHRALDMLPFIEIIAAYGVSYLVNLNKKYLPIIFAFLILNFAFFLHMYAVHAKYKISLNRNGGAKELALYLTKVKENYDQIILTNIPDDPYPWLAFFGKRNPKSFNQDAVLREKGVWSTENIVFSSQRCPSRDAYEKAEVATLLVVDAVGCATESKLYLRDDIKVIKEIKIPSEDDIIVYTLWSKIK